MSKDWEQMQSETIDFLKPIMAFMVVCLHAQLFYVGEQWSLSGGGLDVVNIIFCKTLCPVAVPIFFFFSGYLFFKGLEDWNAEVWKQKISRRVRTLLVPFLLWNLIALFAFPLTRLGGSVLKDIPLGDLMAPLRERGIIRLFWDRTLYDGVTFNSTNILGWTVPTGQPMNTPLWFVRDLMVVIAFSPVIHWVLKKTGYVAVFLLSALYLADIWIPISGFGIKATFFFSWGALFSIKGATFLESFRKLRIPVIILFLAGLITIPLIWDKDRQLFSLLVRIFVIISLVFSVNTASVLLEDGFVKLNGKLTASSFFVYCAHMVIISSAVMWVIMSIPFNSGVMRAILFFAGAIAIFYICHGIFILLQRFCPSVAGVLTGGRSSNREKA